MWLKHNNNIHFDVFTFQSINSLNKYWKHIFIYTPSFANSPLCANPLLLLNPLLLANSLLCANPVYTKNPLIQILCPLSGLLFESQKKKLNI